MGRVTNLVMDILGSFDRFFDLSPYFREREVKSKALRGWGYMESNKAVPKGVAMPVVLRPQTNGFRIVQINWDVENVSNWLVVDIRVGNRSQFVISGDIPLSKIDLWRTSIRDYPKLSRFHHYCSIYRSSRRWGIFQSGGIGGIRLAAFKKREDLRTAFKKRSFGLDFRLSIATPVK